MYLKKRDKFINPKKEKKKKVIASTFLSFGNLLGFEMQYLTNLLEAAARTR